MKILEKHVSVNYIFSFIFCISLLMVLGVIGDILGFLDDIFKNNIPLVSILKFYFYFAPFAFVNMLPFACLLSAVYVFNDLSKNREVTAIIASGVSLWKVLRPVLFITFILCLVTFIVNEKMVPGSMRKANFIKQDKLEASKGGDDKVIKNLAVYGKDDRIIFAREYYPVNKKLEGVIIHKQDEDQVVTEKINAKTIKWRNDGFWLGMDVMVFKMKPDGKFSWEPEVYKNRKMPIRETPEELMNTQWDPKLMNYKQLKDYIDILYNNSKISAKRLMVDLHYKLSFPFTAMITVLVGIPFSIATGRVNALMGMAKGITVAMMYLPVSAVSLALGKGGILSPVLSAWISIIIFSLIGIYSVNTKD